MLPPVPQEQELSDHRQEYYKIRNIFLQRMRAR